LVFCFVDDTLLLKSTTTTNGDIIAVQNLSEFIGINYTKYGYDMLLAGTDASDYSEYDIITTDSKAYTINGYPIEIATIKSVNTTEILVRKKKLLEEIDKYIINKKKELFIFTIVDIINIDTYLFARGNLSSSVEKAFGIKLEDNQFFLEGKNSRKNDIYPPIAKAIKELPEYDGIPSSGSSSSNNETFDRYDQKANLSKNIKLNYLLVLALLLL